MTAADPNRPTSAASPPPVSRPPAGWRRRAGKGVAVCAWLYLALVLGLWALLRAADLWWPATLLMFSPRWLLLLPSAPLALAAAAWRRRSLALLLLAVALVLGPVMGLCVPWQRLGPAPAGTRLRLLTCNLHYEAGDPAALGRLLAEADPDIVALQEWPRRGGANLFAGQRWHVHRAPGLFLASRYPIRRAERLGEDSTGESGSVMRYELETPAGRVTLLSLHLASPRPGLQGAAHERGRAPAELEAGSALRWRQSEHVAREAERATGPVLLAGDFNTPPESALFRRVWGRYTDAFGAAGWGWGYTFSAGTKAVRIDHVLAGPGWHCDRCWVGHDVGSPHRPVLADLIWPAAQ
jgi:vancomycin resistance protein VanJ